MATLNLGRIKPVFRGAYAGGTAYVVDDIVTSGNETFICILASTGNATSNATYWTKLAAKGADGTDVGTTITTQGDILYRDGSGLQRLAKGTAGQALIMNSGATAPEWGAAGVGGTKAFYAYQDANSSAMTNTAQNEIIFSHERHDDDSLYNTSTGRYTPAAVGTYFVTANVTVNDMNGTGDDLYLKFMINGSSSVEYGSTHFAGSGAPFSTYHATAVIKLTDAAHYISAWIYHDAGNDRYWQGSGNSNFSGFRLS